jgi:hypothetical protein
MKKYSTMIASFLGVLILFFGINGFSQDFAIPSINTIYDGTIVARPITQIPHLIKESSGISVSGPNRIWSHNDAGNPNELYCFDTTGNLLRVLEILDATNVDWEDLTEDNQKRVYINDAGNNNNDRQNLRIYRIPDPQTVTGNVVEAEAIKFVLEDQFQFPPPANNMNYDIEAMFWKDDSLNLFTKNRSEPQSGICKLYRLPALPGTYTAKLIGAIQLGNSFKDAQVTSADVNLATGEVLLLTEKKIVSFTNYPGNRFFDGDITMNYFAEETGQVEGVAFVDNNRLFLTAEGNNNSGGYLYEVLWENSSAVNESGLDKVRIFPNPFINNLTIEMPYEGDLMVEIMDIQGNLVYKNPDADRLIDLHHLRPGVYILRLYYDNEILIRRIIKHQ